MNLIYQIFQRFYNVLDKRSKPSPDSISDNTKYVSGIIFKITENLELDIGCVLPDLHDYSTDEISDLAEKYAELLIMINGGIFKNQIFDMLNTKIESIDCKDKDRLFINNVLSFDRILNQELNKVIKNNRPLIRPTSVFKNL
jgi:hypothetical protein